MRNLNGKHKTPTSQEESIPTLQTFLSLRSEHAFMFLSGVELRKLPDDIRPEDHGPGSFHCNSQYYSEYLVRAKYPIVYLLHYRVFRVGVAHQAWSPCGAI